MHPVVLRSVCFEGASASVETDLKGLRALSTLRPLSHCTPGSKLSSARTTTDTTTIKKSNCTGVTPLSLHVADVWGRYRVCRQ